MKKDEVKNDSSNDNMVQDMKDSHYFLSWRGFDSSGREITYGSVLIPFSDSKEIEKIKKNFAEYATIKAKEHNDMVSNVHIVAFNKA